MSSYRTFDDFGAEEIRTFLRAVDRHLSRHTRMVLIGVARPRSRTV